MNKKAFKLTFSGTGAITLTQSLGTMEAGNYKIAVEAAYPEGSKYRPSYIQYGFSENKSTAYLSGYTADEFHTYSKEVKITKATKSVAVTVYGYAGSVLYVTDIRCLRDMQELLDDIDTKLEVEVGKVTASVNEVYENTQHDYCQNGSFSNNDDAFASWYRSSTTYITKVTENSKNCAKIDRVSTTSSYYLRQIIKVPRTSPFIIRFKARCDAGQENTARIRISFGGTSKYTSAGRLTSSYQNFEFRFDSISAGSAYLYVYNYVSGANVYVTDIEVLGYISGYSESQLQVLKKFDRGRSEESHRGRG